jgi:DNA-binding IclR family transcriptional regulator
LRFTHILENRKEFLIIGNAKIRQLCCQGRSTGTREFQLTDKNNSPLERYFRVLETIAVSADGAGVSDIAERCDLPLATAHRLLQNLQSADLIASSGGKRKDYQLGQRLLRLLHAGSDATWLAISVQPILDKLANEFADTCYLARLVGHEVISVAWAVPSDGLGANVIPGYTLAPHVAASAKAILAFQSRDLIDLALAGPLPKLATETKTRRKEIDRDYAAVRENGFATCWNEMEVGMGAIAVPIPLPDIGVIYSLGTAGLIDRLTRRPVAESVKVLRSAVGPLVRALSNRQPVDRAVVKGRRGEPLRMQREQLTGRVRQSNAKVAIMSK